MMLSMSTSRARASKSMQTSVSVYCLRQSIGKLRNIQKVCGKGLIKQFILNRYFINVDTPK